MLAAVADTGDPWRWQPHPEVWLLMVCVIGLGLYVTRVIAPKVVEPGEVAVTRRQKGFFVAGVITLWAASDWPLHDLGENNLFVLHMVQHFLLTMVVPPLFLLAVPTWLARLAFPDDGRAKVVLRRFVRPVTITVAFNAWVVFTHWQPVVNTSVQVGPIHYVVHLISVSLALGMWINVCGPWPEWRLSPPNQCGYLFLQSVVVTIPSAWITMAADRCTACTTTSPACGASR
jgi:putative membrane protein